MNPMIESTSDNKKTFSRACCEPRAGIVRDDVRFLEFVNALM